MLLYSGTFVKLIKNLTRGNDIRKHYIIVITIIIIISIVLILGGSYLILLADSTLGFDGHCTDTASVKKTF